MSLDKEIHKTFTTAKWKGLLEASMEEAKGMGAMYKLYYDSFIEAGFDKEQALSLTSNLLQPNR